MATTGPSATLASPLDRMTAQILNTASVSDAINLTGFTLVGIEMPSAWDAANLTFQSAPDGSTYKNLYDEFGTEITVTAAASRVIRLDPAQWAGVKFLKIRSGTSGTAVNQTADRTLGLVLRAI